MVAYRVINNDLISRLPRNTGEGLEGQHFSGKSPLFQFLWRQYQRLSEVSTLADGGPAGSRERRRRCLSDSALRSCSVS